MDDCRKPALAELLALEARAGAAHHGGITHFKESGDVYPHDADDWPVDPGRTGGLGDQRGSGRLAGVKSPRGAGWGLVDVAEGGGFAGVCGGIQSVRIQPQIATYLLPALL